jgi:nitrous oxide reductase
MEQTNLVCSPDGKTWDEVTRDTSYLGTDGFLVTEPQDTGGAVQDLIFTEFRGVSFGSACYNKNFAIAYDRMICLKDGVYFLKFQTIENTNANASYIKVNGTVVAASHTVAASWSSANNSTVVQLKRGDHINVSSPSSENYSYVNFIAYKIR